MKPISVVSGGLVLGFVLLAGALAWRSASWPLVHDGPIMHYIAWRMTEGAVPYRDLFDMNFPGVYLIHMAVLTLLGAGDAAWRIFDLAWLTGGALAVAALAAPWGFVAAVGGAWFFVAYHLAGGAWNAGQRDFLLCPFLLLGAWGVARWSERSDGRIDLAAGGLALGAGIMIKPHAAAFAVALALLIAGVAWREGRTLWASSALFIATTALLPLAVIGWLAARGGLGDWYQIVVHYLLPLYGHLGRPERWAFHRWPLWIPIGTAVAIALAHALI